MTLTIGATVRVKDTYRDEQRTIPLVGTIEDMFPRPDWNGRTAHVVMFEGVSDAESPGGEFTADMLEVAAGRSEA